MERYGKDENVYLVICQDEAKHYVLASSRFFDTWGEALEYRNTVHSSLHPAVLKLNSKFTKAFRALRTLAASWLRVSL